jgi:hypothetical protein
MGIELVASLREFLMLKLGLSLNEAQERAQEFVEREFCVDWITLTGRSGIFKTFYVGLGVDYED